MQAHVQLIHCTPVAGGGEGGVFPYTEEVPKATALPYRHTFPFNVFAYVCALSDGFEEAEGNITAYLPSD